MTPKDEYDPAVHVTAGELRASGILVPSNIPDVGFVRRGSIKHEVDTHATADEIAAGEMRATLRFEFTEPFQWVEAEITIPKDATQLCPECNGTGRLPRPEDHELSGERPAEIERAAIEALPCMTCNGLGIVPAVPPVGLLNSEPLPGVSGPHGPIELEADPFEVAAFLKAAASKGGVPAPCPTCKGKGRVDCGRREDDDPDECGECERDPETCNGSAQCDDCQGTGQLTYTRHDPEAARRGVVESFRKSDAQAAALDHVLAKGLEAVAFECPVCLGSGVEDVDGSTPLKCSTCDGTGRNLQHKDDGHADPCPRCNGSGDDPSSSIGLRYNCTACNGTGRVPVPVDPAPEGEPDCPECKGSGIVPAKLEDAEVGKFNARVCPTCDGTGRVGSTPLARKCRNCDGRGFTPKTFPNGQQAVVGDPCSVCKGKGYVDA